MENVDQLLKNRTNTCRMFTRYCSPASLDYNNIPPIQNAINNCRYVEYPCLTASSQDSHVPLEFRVDATDECVDLSQVYLRYNFQVLKSDGSSLAKNDEISTVNNFGYSLFSGIDLFIQDVKITGNPGYYPYISYVLMLLHATPQEKKYLLREALWRDDQAGMFDVMGTDEAGAANQGFLDRAAYVQSSIESSITIKVFGDFSVRQLIPSQTELFYRFHRSDPNTCLLAKNGDYKIKITQARLLVSKSNLSPGALAACNSLLAKGGIFLPGSRLSAKTRIVSRNDQNCDWTAISGKIPKRLYIFQILNSAYNGAIDKNMYNFQTFNLKRIQVFRNGTSLPCGQPIELDGDDGQLLYTMSMRSLNRSESICFNSWQFCHGFFVVCYDLTADFGAGMSNYDNAAGFGTVRIVIDYDEPLSDTATIFCISEESAALHLDTGKKPSWH